MIDRAVKLTGTTEAEPPLRHLVAGPLSAVLDQGGLRWVRWHDVEILRGLFFLVRNAGWGTPPVTIEEQHVEQEADGFRVAYRGSVRDGAAWLSVAVDLQGSSSGTVVARAEVTPKTAFVTNRTGFVVLHPIKGFAGAEVAVTHADGTTEALRISKSISPGQPVRDIRGLRYAPCEGLSVALAFTGEVFEMEDQRNWTDASFKTYSRPLDWPRPFTLPAGTPIVQSVTITVADTRTLPTARPPAAPLVTVGLGAVSDTLLPRIGLALSSDLAAASLAHAERLGGLGLDHLSVRHDPSALGNEGLAAVAALSKAVGLPVALDIMLLAQSDPAPEIAAIAAEAAKAGLDPFEVAAFPKVDERSFQPGEERPPSPAFEHIHGALRRAFPKARIAGGTPAFFTELNRRRVPVETLDVLTHGTCAIVHAADDRSVMETLESLPWIIRTTRAFAGGRPIRLGPIAIGARINPYGTAPEQNPDNRRVGLAGADPRQRGLFAAAWHVGYAATVAPHDIDSLIVGAPIGAFGLVDAPNTEASAGERPAARLVPAFHAVAALARGGGKRRIETSVSDASAIAALAWRDEDRATLLLANLTAVPQVVRLADGEAAGSWRARALDAASYDLATTDGPAFAGRSEVIAADEVHLDAYAVAIIEGQRS